MYLRFLKREDTIVEIINLFENINNLSDESNIKFKKIITNELRYNKRILKNIDNNLNKKNEKKEVETKKKQLNDETDITQTEEQQHKNDLDFIINLIDKPAIESSCSEQYKKSLSNENFLTQRLEYYNSQYNFSNLLAYDKNFLINCINFFRNILKYSWNKRIIKSIERDYNIFYRGEDLKCYIDYSKKRNSIMVALAIIFKNSHLSKREIECLYNHDKCKQWIIEFHSQQYYKYDNDACLIREK